MHLDVRQLAFHLDMKHVNGSYSLISRGVQHFILYIYIFDIRSIYRCRIGPHYIIFSISHKVHQLERRLIENVGKILSMAIVLVNLQ